MQSGTYPKERIERAPPHWAHRLLGSSSQFIESGRSLLKSLSKIKHKADFCFCVWLPGKHKHRAFHPALNDTLFQHVFPSVKSEDKW